MEDCTLEGADGGGGGSEGPGSEGRGVRGNFPQRVLEAISNCTELVGGWVII